jgi:hypothetical protein
MPEHASLQGDPMIRTYSRFPISRIVFATALAVTFLAGPGCQTKSPEERAMDDMERQMKAQVKMMKQMQKMMDETEKEMNEIE